MKPIRIHQPHFWLIILLTVGIVYLFSLQLLAADGVYFSGDSGLKAMLSQDLASNSLAFDMNYRSAVDQSIMGPGNVPI